ncbi:MAG: PIG-L family deacetylase [Thermomicrobiales bacterium]
MNVVSIMAHQDDEMRCLGTMLKCRARCDRLHFITLTDGSKGFVQQPDIDRATAAAIRDREMRAIADDLDATFINLGEPDEYLADTPAVRDALIEAIRRCRADLVFTHFTQDYNLDHTITSALVRHCAMQSCLPVLPTASPPLAAHPAVFMVEPHGPFPFHPSHYVDIAAQRDEKVRLLALHVSQEEAMQLGTGTGVAELTAKVDAFRGDQVGVAWAEAFVPMPARGAFKPFPVLP